MKPLKINNALKCAALAAMFPMATFAHAKCDEWLPFYEGPNGRVTALIVYNNALIAGGLFSSSGVINVDDTTRYIAQFDGQRWSSLAGGMSGGGSQSGSAGVRALAVFNEELIAGGYFTRAGGIPAYGIARWNGREWLSLGDGMSAGEDGDDDPGVLALTEFNGELIAGGTFTTAGDSEARFIASWDGESWAPIGAGIDSPVFALTVYKGRLVAGGEDFIMSWDGESWSPFGGDPQPSGTVRALLEHNDQLIAGGRFVGPLGATHHGILQTNGSQWTPVGSEISEDFDAGALGDIYALMNYNGDLIAAGLFESGGPSIARFNGTFWLPLGMALGGSEALTIYNNALTAGGEFMADDNTVAYVGRWFDCMLTPENPADANGDGLVDITDLLMVLTQFGVCPDTIEPCSADIAPYPGGDGVVDMSDLLEVINHWN